jgi:ABC-2 type transport system ATP-binding protein
MVNNSVEVTGLRVVRGGRSVIDGLDWRVPAGLIVGLLGPSGCGKSTLMRAIVGVQVIREGTVTVLGKPAGSRELRSRVGYVTQVPSVYGDLTVQENLDYFARVWGKRRTQQALELVDLQKHAKSRVDNLSGGQRSRVSLAAALIGEPELLVLDEPTVGLDPLLRRDLWNLFHQLSRDGATLVVSSHVMDEAQRCDRIMLMREGQVVADDTLEHLLRETHTDDVESAFLAKVEQ